MSVSINKQFDTIELGIANMLSAANHDYNKFLDNEKMQKQEDQELTELLQNSPALMESRQQSRVC